MIGCVFLKYELPLKKIIVYVCVKVKSCYWKNYVVCTEARSWIFNFGIIVKHC